MFVRFRQQGSRLQSSLTQTRRIAGKMHTEHIASLGSVDADVSIRTNPDAAAGRLLQLCDHAPAYALLKRVGRSPPAEQREGDDTEPAE